ncbi:MAG: hypothetical protein JWP01_3265 [Myxococcales bacterium]|nr:hypothetical protein [Myxococcales bacterium]
MAPLAPRALRIGVLLGGNLVEERVFTGLAPITFGQSLRCSLSIPGDGVPYEHVLFARDQGRLLLRVSTSIEGRLATASTVTTDLRVGPGDGGIWTIPLEKGVRGRLQIGEATVLFQEIATPPITPRPVLPASIRGTFGDRIDRRLAVIVGGSLAVHLAIGVWAWATEVETIPLMSSPVAALYRHDTMSVSLPELTPDVPPSEPGPGAATPVAPVQTAKPIVDRPRSTPRAAQPPGMSAAEAARYASILTGPATGPNGPSEMRNRQPGADLRQQIDDVGTRTVTIGDDGKGFREQPGPRIGTEPGPLVDDPTGVTPLPTHRAEEPRGGRSTLRPVPVEGPGTTLTVDMVLSKITTVYMQGLQRCYRKGLLGEASLAGKIKMGFSVTERGGLDDIEASGVSSEVDTCISTQMQSWRFPIPKDKDGDPTDQEFRLVLALQPS